jgi:hypothetical protein
MPDTKIESVSSFVSDLAKFERRHIAQWFFRGHSDSNWILVPGLFRLKKEREESFSNWEDLEAFLFAAFKREAAQFLPAIVGTELEDLMCLGQHYGLPTRLLDWTTNPLIALFFAVESDDERNADVWCMGFPSTNNCQPSGTYFSQRCTLYGTDFILFPRHIDSRIINQGGCFTKHADEVPLDQQGGVASLCTFNRFTIEAGLKSQIRSQLYDMGIHISFIYPGLDSLAKRLRYELTGVHSRH